MGIRYPRHCFLRERDEGGSLRCDKLNTDKLNTVKPKRTSDIDIADRSLISGTYCLIYNSLWNLRQIYMHTLYECREKIFMFRKKRNMSSLVMRKKFYVYVVK